VTSTLDDELAGDLGLARAGDAAAFGRLVEPLRGELHAHCYRMLGSSHDADDALQDALLRAWRGIARFEGRSTLRSWLYTVATRTCLDSVDRRGRRALPVDLGPASDRVVGDDRPRTDLAWLGPYPDAGLAAEQREAVELAFVAACQHLPANQRAALLLFDVLGFSAAEIARMMDTTPTSVNSALARARRLVAQRVPARTRQPAAHTLADPRLRATVEAFATALTEGDADRLVALLTEDVTWSMPPQPAWYRGIRVVEEFVRQIPLGSCGTWRCLSTSANGAPALGLYLRGEGGEAHHGASLTVLTPRDGLIAEITTFLGAEHLAAFGLPPVLG
jgi:RNA polymerase sigma-70 factor, ECF subfamily